MLINRSELRLALAAGLSNGLAVFSGVPNGLYAPLAVLATGTGTYGGSLGLGLQRILGSVLGMALLLIGFHTMKGLPMPLALAITLASLRLLGGLLRLEVGYKVGGQIVVLGWLAHANQLAQWVPTRLLWTIFGVIFSMLSLRLFWPSRGLEQAMTNYSRVLSDLQDTLRRQLDRGGIGAGSPLLARRDQNLSLQEFRRLIGQLVALRRQRPALAQELGNNPERHPAYRLMASLDETASWVITSIGGLLRHPPPDVNPELVRRLNQAEADMLKLLIDRLALWQEQLAVAGSLQRLPQPPEQPMELPETWLRLSDELNDPMANAAPLERLEQIAIRLMFCRQAQQALRDGEANWARIVAPG